MGFLRKLRWVLVDALLAALALTLAYLLLVSAFRFLGEAASDETRLYLKQMAFFLPFIVLLRVLLLLMFGLYRSISRFAGIHDLRQIIFATGTGSLLLIVWNLATRFAPWLQQIDGGVRSWMPFSVIVVEALMFLFFVGGVRLGYRLWGLSRFNSAATVHNVMLIGAGDIGEGVARHFLNNPQMGYRPVGFVDEDTDLRGRQIHGLTVFGGIRELPALIDEHDIDEVLVAARKPSRPFLNEIVEMCEAAHVGFKIIPAYSDVMQERVSINQIRPVEIEDLLGREAVDLTLDPERDYIKGRTVLVTGAGGSIGSELCRQIMRQNPRKIVLLGRGENSVFEIGIELGYRHDRPGILALEIADIQDVDRMEQIFEQHRPEVVFHAAAHKHVPLMEANPGEAVKNNVIGTFNCAFLAREFEARHFILISTDKAVHPSSVMGATKRLAEMVLSALSRDPRNTEFIAVRFGNVLGSRGSVVPIFRRQIEEGGPVTVMHPEIERYFMTIPEAASLVVQAGAIGANGQLFLLDMGEPVRIAELARRMITLSGYEPEVDINIEFIGLRPGEKLQEELLTETENIEPSEHPKIHATRVTRKPSLNEVKRWLRRLDDLVRDGTRQQVIDGIAEIVPEYKPKRSPQPAAAPKPPAQG